MRYRLFALLRFVQLQIIQRETHAELYLLGEKLLEFSQALAGVGFGLDIHGEDGVVPLDEEVLFVRRIVPAPVAGHDFKLCQQRLQYKILGQRALEFGKEAVALAESCGSQLCQMAEQSYVHQINLEGGQIIVGRNRQPGRGAAVNLMYQPGVHQPLQRVLVRIPWPARPP